MSARRAASRLRIALGAAVLLAVAAGCEAVLGLGSFSDEGATDGGARGATDGAATDGGATDGAARPDASWCFSNAPDASLCDDFDESMATFPFPFAVTAAGGGDGGLDDSSFVSPPFGFTASTPALEADATARWALVWSPTTTSPSIHLAFDLRVDSAPSTDVLLGEIGLAGDGTVDVDNTFYVVVAFAGGNGGGLHLEERVPPSDGGPAEYRSFPPFANPIQQQWSRVELVLALDSSGNGTASVTVFDSGATRPTTPTSSMTIQCPEAVGAPRFQVGQVFNSGPSVSEAVHFDDVVIDMQ